MQSRSPGRALRLALPAELRPSSHWQIWQSDGNRFPPGLRPKALERDPQLEQTIMDLVLGLGARIPQVTLRDPRELTAYAVLGVAGGISSLVFSKALGYLRPRLRSLAHWTHFFQPGYGVMDQAMHGQFAWQLLVTKSSDRRRDCQQTSPRERRLVWRDFPTQRCLR